jgi:hypothetical protein
MTRALGRRPRQASTAHYKFRFGDFRDVERAVAHLHGMLELLRQRA